MELINIFFQKLIDYIFRKPSIPTKIFSSGITLVTVSLIGGQYLNVSYGTPSKYLLLTVTSSDTPAVLIMSGFWFGIFLSTVGLFSLLFCTINEYHSESRKKVLVIEQRGLANTVDSPLLEFIKPKHKRKKLIDIVVDIRNQNKEKALGKILNIENTIEENRNNQNPNDFQLIYGGIVSVPFAFTTGYLIDDESSVQALDWDRKSSCWRQLQVNQDDNENFIIEKIHGTNLTETVLAVSFSYHVDKEAINEVFDNLPQTHLLLSKPRNDNHWSKAKQDRLAYEFVEEIKKLEAEGYKKIHLILAAQNSVAFRFGQAYDKRNLPPITIYQYEKKGEVKYPWGVYISNLSPKIVERKITIKE